MRKITLFLLATILIHAVPACKKQTSYEKEMRAYYNGLCAEQQLELEERIAVAKGDMNGAREIKAENDKVRQACFQSLDRARTIYDGSANRMHEFYEYIGRKNKLESEAGCKEKLTALETELAELEKSGKRGFTLEQKDAMEQGLGSGSYSIPEVPVQRTGDSAARLKPENEIK
ncbi:MAG: hypothetical protein WCI71_10865 [Bacteroidota bacterium]